MADSVKIVLIPCSMLTDNGEYIRVYYEGRMFVMLVFFTHFRGCNGIGDLLTRQARNFSYSQTAYEIFISILSLMIFCRCSDSITQQLSPVTVI